MWSITTDSNVTEQEMAQQRLFLKQTSSSDYNNCKCKKGNKIWRTHEEKKKTFKEEEEGG